MQTYTFKPINQQVRVETIGGEPWFVAKDVCDALALTDVSMTVNRLDDDEKLTQVVLVSGQSRQMWLVSESGLYNLIFQSRKAEAKAFRKWVTGEVLPSIRKTGRYDIKERRRAVPPRERSKELGRFHEELQKWMREEDVKAVAAKTGVTVNTVRSVMQGTKVGLRVLKGVVAAAGENRKAGRQGNLRKPGYYERELAQLTMDFMEGGER